MNHKAERGRCTFISAPMQHESILSPLAKRIRGRSRQGGLFSPPCRKRRAKLSQSFDSLGKGGKCRNSTNLRSACVFVPLGKGDHRGYASNLVAVSKHRYYPVPWGRLLSLGVCIAGCTVVPNYLLQCTRVRKILLKHGRMVAIAGRRRA